MTPVSAFGCIGGDGRLIWMTDAGVETAAKVRQHLFLLHLPNFFVFTSQLFRLLADPCHTLGARGDKRYVVPRSSQIR